MCKIGDIIVINSYKDNGRVISTHSFVVIDDTDGKIEGLPYNFVANVMSSYKTQEQKDWKLNHYPANFPIAIDDRYFTNDNGKEGYIKADQLYYFRKDNIKYKVIGYIIPEILNLLLEFIETSDFDLIDITDNLT